MKPWQIEAILKSTKFNFSEHEDEIKETFKSICEPLSGRDNIQVGEDYLIVNDKKYSLQVIPNQIIINYNDSSMNMNQAFYWINSNNEYIYSDTSNNSRLTGKWTPLTNYELDYEEILDNLMTIAIN